MAENRIGIVGDGQLGRMLTPPAHSLGYEVAVLGSPGAKPGELSPAAQVGALQIHGSIQDEEAMLQLAEWTGRDGVMTIEIEHVNALALLALEGEGYNVQASPESILTIQDKLKQKRALADAGIPVAPFLAIDSEADYEMAEIEFAEGFIVKQRRGGYDGRGNLIPENGDTFTSVAEKLGSGRNPAGRLYAEELLPKNEFALLIARDRKGYRIAYEPVVTSHQNNICHEAHTNHGSVELPPDVSEQAIDIAHSVLDVFKGAGVFAIEMFNVDGRVVVNEVAPRVHNSGHLTMDASETSQFEQHIRAITGLPLGSVETAPAAMVNILGDRHGDVALRGLARAQSIPGVHVHPYGKWLVKPNRKMGHVNAVASDVLSAISHAREARAAISI